MSALLQLQTSGTDRIYRKDFYIFSFPLTHTYSHWAYGQTHLKWRLPKTTSNPNKVQGQQSVLSELKPPTLAFITRERISREMPGYIGWGYVSWLCLSVWGWPGPSSHSLVCKKKHTPKVVTVSPADPYIKPSNYSNDPIFSKPLKWTLKTFYGMILQPRKRLSKSVCVCVYIHTDV